MHADARGRRWLLRRGRRRFPSQRLSYNGNTTLPDETRDALAADAVAAGMEDADELPDDELTAEDLAAIGAGLADMDAGRTLSLAEASAHAEALLEARFGTLTTRTPAEIAE